MKRRKVLPFSGVAGCAVLVCLFMFTFPFEARGAFLEKISQESTKGQTSIVLEFDAPVLFTSNVIKNPTRLYLDFKQADLAHSAPKRLDINDDRVHRVRVGRPDGSTLRVVFDLNGCGRHEMAAVAGTNAVKVVLYGSLEPFSATGEELDNKKEGEKDRLMDKWEQGGKEETEKAQPSLPHLTSPDNPKEPDPPHLSADSSPPPSATPSLNERTVAGQSAGPVSTSESPKPDSAKPESTKNGTPSPALSLNNAFVEAVKNNLALKSAQLTPTASLLDVESAEAAFYPTLTQGVSMSGNIDSRTRSTGSATSISLPLITGGSVSITAGNTVNSGSGIDSTYQSSLGAALSIPLLAGAGTFVNKAPIAISEINAAKSLMTLREQMETLLISVNTSYWTLKFAIDDLHIQKEGLKEAAKLYEKTLTLIKEGELAAIEKYSPEAAISSREDSLLNAEKALKDAQDNLSLLLHRDLSQTITPTSSPQFDYTEPVYEQSYHLALQNRTDYLQAVANIVINTINLKVAENNKLPNLSMNLGYTASSYTGTGGFGQSLSHLGEDRSWTATLNFTLPIPNTIKHNTYVKSKISLDQANIDLEKLKDNIGKDIRQAIIALKTARKKVEVTRKTRELNQLKLNAEKEKLEEGFSDLFAVITYQNDFVSSKLSEARASAEYQVAFLALKKAEGTLLPYLGINFEEIVESTYKLQALSFYKAEGKGFGR